MTPQRERLLEVLKFCLGNLSLIVTILGLLVTKSSIFEQEEVKGYMKYGLLINQLAFTAVILYVILNDFRRGTVLPSVALLVFHGLFGDFLMSILDSFRVGDARIVKVNSTICILTLFLFRYHDVLHEARNILDSIRNGFLYLVANTPFAGPNPQATLQQTGAVNQQTGAPIQQQDPPIQQTGAPIQQQGRGTNQQSGVPGFLRRKTGTGGGLRMPPRT